MNVEEQKPRNFIDRFFKVSERGSTIGREILAGVVVFFAMIYILPVNANMISFNPELQTGMTGATFGSVFAATAIASAIATLIMGLIANYPIALSAGMGMNALIAYTVCGALGYSGVEALALVIIAGLLFLGLSLTKFREKIVIAIPKNLKLAVSTGIGFFIAFVGLREAGIIIGDSATLVHFVKLNENPQALLALFGILLVLGLRALKGKISRFSVIIAMGTTALIGFTLSLLHVPHMPTFDWLREAGSATSSGNISEIKNTFLLGFKGFGTVLADPMSYAIIFTLIFVNIFDTTGTLVAIGKDAGALDPETGELIGGKKAILADAIGAVVGGTLGTSTVTSFVESSVGVESGGRTGLSAVTVAILFGLSLVAFPLFSIFAGEGGSYITALALVAVGIAMFKNLGEFDWDDKISIASSFITIIFMILTASIADGIGLGFISYSLMMLVSGKGKKVHPLLYIIASLFIVNYIISFTILA